MREMNSIYIPISADTRPPYGGQVAAWPFINKGGDDHLRRGACHFSKNERIGWSVLKE
jgi:hypothetical protein